MPLLPRGTRPTRLAHDSRVRRSNIRLQKRRQIAAASALVIEPDRLGHLLARPIQLSCQKLKQGPGQDLQRDAMLTADLLIEPIAPSHEPSKCRAVAPEQRRSLLEIAAVCDQIPIASE